MSERTPIRSFIIYILTYMNAYICTKSVRLCANYGNYAASFSNSIPLLVFVVVF